MCGIAGAAWTAESPPVSWDVLRRMTTALVHRGPDDAGYYHSQLPDTQRARDSYPTTNPSASGSDSSGFPPAMQPQSGIGAALGHRRLSIIDLAGGHQPLSNEDGSVWIVFNGEIYNYLELHQQLAQRGHTFRTLSDTETIVHLYEDYGTDCVQHLRGMFAFAIWDNRKQSLFLARDRLGKKPLVYSLEPHRLLFASELKALLQVPGLSRQLDPRAVDEYLMYQYVPHPGCILQGFHKLPPGHWACYQSGRLETRRYWKPGYEQVGHSSGSNAAGNDIANLSAEEARRELRDRLTTAVKIRMRSDVPLGAFLSGGVDSTIISGLMQSLAEQQIKTFSIGFPDAQFDERSYARQAAAHLGTDHHELVVEPSALNLLPRLIWHYDEPFADSSAIPTLFLSEMTRQSVKVALSGDGGDELFAGYERYLAVALGAKFDRLPRPLQRLLTAKLWQKLPTSMAQRSWPRRFKRWSAVLHDAPERRYLKWMSIFDQDRRSALYTPAFREQLAGFDAGGFLLQAYAECPARDFVTRTTCVDVLSYLPCDILTKVDIATMAYSLEARCPFLDQEVVELAARLPMSSKLRGRRGKRILVETFADFLPPSIQTRRKMGFGVPLANWFRGELRPLLQEVLLDPVSLGRGMFEPAGIRQLVDEHLSGQWDHSYRLWALLVLELWQQTFLDPATPPAGPVRGKERIRLHAESA